MPWIAGYREREQEVDGEHSVEDGGQEGRGGHHHAELVREGLVEDDAVGVERVEDHVLHEVDDGEERGEPVLQPAVELPVVDPLEVDAEAEEEVPGDEDDRPDGEDGDLGRERETPVDA